MGALKRGTVLPEDIPDWMDENEKKAYTIYLTEGQHGVLYAVDENKLKWDYEAWGKPCNYFSPFYKDTCLVCSTCYDPSIQTNETKLEVLLNGSI